MDRTLHYYNSYKEIHNLVSMGYSLVKYRYVKSKKSWRPKYIYDETGEIIKRPIKSNKSVLYIQDNKLYCNGEPDPIERGWGYMVLLGRASRLMVIDIDVRKDGPTLNELLSEIKDNLGWLGKTSYVRTPSGGIHLYYKIPKFKHPQSTLIDPYDTFKSRAPETLLAKCNVDVRVGHNSPIPLPGVEKRGIAYKWERGYITDCSTMPENIAVKFCNPYEFENYDHLNINSTKTISDDHLNRLVNDIASTAEGGRDCKLNANSFILGRYVAAGRLDYNLAYSSLISAGLACGLTRYEVESTVKRALQESRKVPIYD